MVMRGLVCVRGDEAAWVGIAGLMAMMIMLESVWLSFWMAWPLIV